MKKQRKKQHKAKNTLCVLLGLVLVVCGVWAALYFSQGRPGAPESSQVQPGYQADEAAKNALQPVCGSLNLSAEIINAEQVGDVLKLDYIQPGLDTYTLTVVLYSLKENKVLLQKDFGTDAFETGQTANGFYVARLQTKKIEFYSNNGALQQTVTLPQSITPSTLCVSQNKSYACIVDGCAVKILVYSFAEKQVTASCKSSGYLKFVGERDGVFYLQNNSESLLKVTAKTGDFHRTDYQSSVRAFTKYGAFTETETGFACPKTGVGKKTTVTVNLIDEVLLAANQKYLLTLTGNNSEKLTVYNIQNGKNVSYNGPSFIRQALPLENGDIFITAGQTAQTPYLLQTKKLTFRKNKAAAGASAPAQSSSESVSSLAATVPKNGGKLLSGVPVLSQFPNYPTGCESVSAVIAVRAAGDKLSVKSFVNNYLQKSSSFYLQDGKKYGPDPRKYFIGTPTSRNAYGCMAPVIEAALNKFYAGKKTVVNATGASLEQLCTRFINNRTPCIVWASIDMAEPYYSSIWHLEGGGTYTWLANEHCLVLMGYDNENYYFSDPYKGAVVKYKKALCQSRYQAFGQQALAIK